MHVACNVDDTYLPKGAVRERERGFWKTVADVLVIDEFWDIGKGVCSPPIAAQRA